MYYSYVMGIDDSIKDLPKEGFDIRSDGSNYMVIFQPDSSVAWEEFITAHLEIGYWNEYLAEDRVVFLFHLEDGIKRYEVQDFDNDEVLKLCEELCECKFESLKAMLLSNHYYKDILEA